MHTLRLSRDERRITFSSEVRGSVILDLPHLDRAFDASSCLDLYSCASAFVQPAAWSLIVPCSRPCGGWVDCPPPPLTFRRHLGVNLLYHGSQDPSVSMLTFRPPKQYHPLHRTSKINCITQIVSLCYPQRIPRLLSCLASSRLFPRSNPLAPARLIVHVCISLTHVRLSARPTPSLQSQPLVTLLCRSHYPTRNAIQGRFQCPPFALPFPVAQPHSTSPHEGPHPCHPTRSVQCMHMRNLRFIP